MANWKYLKIFVSSTFVDMDMERDALKTIVEPELNEYLKEYGCSLEFVDLRHSVKTETNETLLEREKKIFNICLNEIENCQPYFLGIVGHRYGWIPAKDGVPVPEIAIPEGFPVGKEQLSVTMYEFLHGVFSPDVPEGRSLIMLRDEKSYSNLPELERQKYIDEGEGGKRIEKVREYIRDKREGIKVSDYVLDLASKDDKELLEWASNVSSLIKELIKEELAASEKSEYEEFVIAQEKYVQDHIKEFVGRDEELAEVKERLNNKGKGLTIGTTGPGNGLTSFYCKLYDEIRKDDRNICLFFSHHADSRYGWEEYLYFAMQRLASYLDQASEGKIADAKGNRALLYTYSQEMIDKAVEKGYKVYIFSEIFGETSLKGMSRKSYLVTTDPDQREEDPYLNAYYILPPLGEITVRQILGKLRPEVVETLLRRPAARNAKWLAYAKEILSNLNKIDFQTIRSREEEDNETRILRHQIEIAESLPDETKDIIPFWVERLKKVFGSEIIDNYLFLMSITTLGWNDKTLERILECDTVMLSTVRQMLGEKIIHKTRNGLWNYLNDEICEILSKDFELKKFRKLISQGNRYLTSLKPDDMVYRQKKYLFAMLDREYQFCVDYIATRQDPDSEEVEEGIEAFCMVGERYPLEYLNFIAEISRQRKNTTYDFYYYLKQWMINLHGEGLDSLYVESLRQMSANIRKLWVEDKIDLDVYSIEAMIKTSLLNYYSKENDYANWKNQLEDCLKFTKEYCFKNDNFLTHYLYAIGEKYKEMQFCAGEEEAYEWLRDNFIRQENEGKIRMHPDHDPTEYAQLLWTTSRTLTYRDEMEEAEKFCRKAFALFIDFLRKRKAGTIFSAITVEAAKRNVLYVLHNTLKLHYHYGLLDKEELDSLAETIWEECGKIEIGDEDPAYALNLKSRALHCFMSEMPEPEKFRRLMEMSNRIMDDRVERSEVSQFTFIISEVNEEEIYGSWEAWFYIVSLAMYIICDAQPGEFVYPDDRGWLLPKSESKPATGQSVNFEDELTAIIRTINFKKPDREGGPHRKVWDSLVMLYMAMMYRELEKETIDLAYVIALHNTILDLMGAIREYRVSVPMIAFTENLDALTNHIQQLLTPEIAAKIDFDARYSLLIDTKERDEIYNRIRS